MNNNFIIMFSNGLLLIILGMIGYINTGSATALIAPAIGLLLTILSFPVKNGSKTAGHIGVTLTLITGILLAWRYFIGRSTLILILSLMCLVSVVFYIRNFIKRKNELKAE